MKKLIKPCLLLCLAGISSSFTFGTRPLPKTLTCEGYIFAGSYHSSEFGEENTPFYGVKSFVIDLEFYD
jgi:hypothetical protein